MNTILPRPTLILILLATLLLPATRTSAAATPTETYLGSITAIRGTVEFRETRQSPSLVLDPGRDRFRPLRQGNELRCTPGASIVVQLLFGLALTNRAMEWFPIPRNPPPDDASLRRLQQHRAENWIGAGRTRGRSPARRALLVGIDSYLHPPGSAEAADAAGPRRRTWPDLGGCCNDVEGMAALLVSRFAFAPADLIVLTNAAATRAAVLAAFESHLVAPAAPGDVSVFFFAGHGSQVVNSLSDEADRRDESLVPADSALGAPDIRDKELRRLLNAALDRGAFVATLVDACHSGSVTRGSPARIRALEPEARDIRDPGDPGPPPASRSDAAFVSFAAAESTQSAQESSLDGHPHGAFSSALLRALRSGDAREPALDLFLRTHGFLKSDGLPQNPILETSPGARGFGVFGQPPSDSDPTRSRPPRPAFAVASVDPRSGDIRILGGPVAGLHEGCELRPRRSSADDAGSASPPPPRLRIHRVERLSRSVARALDGSAEQVPPGTLYEIDRWSAPDPGPLRVWLPDAAADPTLTPADAFAASAGVTFAPVPPGLQRALPFGPGTAQETVEIVSDPARAHYRLATLRNAGAPAFAWVLAGNGTVPSANPAPPLPLPGITAPCRVRPATPASGLEPDYSEAGRQLAEQALRLARTRAWLQLESPGFEEDFPYHLALRRADTGEEIRDGIVTQGDAFGLVLRRPAAVDPEAILPRYVYVFVLDSLGRGQLLFASTHDEDGRLPAPRSGNPETLRLGPPRLLVVAEPYGIDTYFLVASGSPLPAPEVLSFDGVADPPAETTRGSRLPTSPLQRLLERPNSRTRGASLTPLDWSIQRFSVESRPAPSPRTGEH